MTIKLAIVGCGRISHAHGIAARRLGNDQVRFVACSDVRPEAAAAWAREYGCERHYASSEEMLERERVDGVVLATWPAQHREQIAAVARAGHRFVLCEKSLASSREDALAIWDIARRHDMTIVEGFMYVHHPAIERIDDFVRSGAAGRIDWVRSASSYLFAETSAGDDPGRSWRFRTDTGGGVPYDLTCYTVNACIRYAGGLPTRVHGIRSFSARYGTVNRLFGTIEFDNGCVGVIESSATAMFNQEIQVNGSQRLIHMSTAFTPPGDATVTERFARKPMHVEETAHRIEVPLPLQDDLPTFYSYQLQMDRFVRTIRGDAAPHPSLASSIVNVLTIDALLLSGQEERAVDVDIPENVRQSWLPALAARG